MASPTWLQAVTALLAVTALQFANEVTATTLCGCASRFDWENEELTDNAIAELSRHQDSSTTALLSFGDYSNVTTPTCKVFPGDALWPLQKVWDIFNTTLGGALVQTVPLAAPCYNSWPERDEATCQYITEHWSDPHLHVNDPASTQWPLFQGRTCLPTDDPNGNCTLGGYASYSVAVTKVTQIQLALNFARNTHIRLVVKNTGHDFMDKSIGAGALSIWTHKLKDIEFFEDYRCKGHSGPAFKLGAGVETEEVYRAAEDHGVTAVGGECRVSGRFLHFARGKRQLILVLQTVGLAGGYVAGGGHSPMSTLVGMGADQVRAALAPKSKAGVDTLLLLLGPLARGRPCRRQARDCERGLVPRSVLGSPRRRRQ